MGFNYIKQDFSKAAEVPFVFSLKLPTGEDSGAKLHVIGDQSAAVKQHSKNIYQRFQQKEATAKRKGKEPEAMTLDEADALSVEGALVRLVGWEGIEGEDGKAVKFTKEAAEEFLKNVEWARPQIMEQSADVVNFRPK